MNTERKWQKFGRSVAIGAIAVAGASCASKFPDKVYNIKHVAGDVFEMSVILGRPISGDGSVSNTNFLRSLSMGIHDFNKVCKIIGLSVSPDGNLTSVSVAQRDCAEGFEPRSSYESRRMATVQTPDYDLKQIGKNVILVTGFSNGQSEKDNAQLGVKSIPDSCNQTGDTALPLQGIRLVTTNQDNCL